MFITYFLSEGFKKLLGGKITKYLTLDIRQVYYNHYTSIGVKI